MRALTDLELLEAWERGIEAPPIERPLDLLAPATGPETTRDALAGLPIGRRDARLLELRRRTFGERFAGVADCPACAAKVEFDLDLDAVAIEAPPEPGSLALERAGVRVRFRLPCSRDLAALAGCSDPAIARARLLERCLMESRDRQGRAIDAAELPPGIVEEVVTRMAEADPQAEIHLTLDCPECGARWEAPFDIATTLWSEVQARAMRLLEEVHELARAYGWSEIAILEMGPVRRRAYLELVRG